MAQYYQIQNLDDLKQIYTDVQVVHVASEDVGVSSHNRSQQLLLPEDQLMLNDGQQVVYQTSSTPAQPQYQQQSATATTQYIIGDEIAQQQQPQQQHQQVMLHQHQAIDHHQQQQQQQIAQQSAVQQQHYAQDTQQMQSEHHQLQQHQPQPQLYYTTEQILQPTTMVQHAPQQELQQQQQQQQQLHVQHQQQQQQYQQQQQIVHQQHSMQAPQQQSIVYRMQSQQPQQTQMLNNAHVILQQPSGQQVLIQSPQHQDIIMRQTMPQQRIIYNTNRVLYSPQQQPQTQTILQQTPSPHQQQQHIQLQTNPIHTPARLVQTRVATAPQEQQQQQQSTQSHQQMQQGVVFHQIQTVQSPQLKPSMQQQQQLQIQQQQQQLVSTGTTAGGNMRGTIRGKLPARGGGITAAGVGATHTLIARIPSLPTNRTVRPTGAQGNANVQRTSRPRGGATSASPARSRGAARGGRGGTLVAAGRGTPLGTTVAGGNIQAIGQQQQQTPQSQQTLIQSAISQGKNITILNQQGQVKHIYRTVVDPQQSAQPQQQLHLVQQQRTQSVGGTPRYRSPPMSTGNTQTQTQIQISPSMNSSTGSGSSAGSTNSNFEQDLEDSIQAVVVKKEQQKAATMAGVVGTPMGTTLTTYFSKDDDDNNRMVRTNNGTCITLAEYKKRHLPTSPQSTATIAPMKMPMRAGGPPITSGATNSAKLPSHGAASGIGNAVPVARVAPQLQQQQQQQQQQHQQLQTQPTASAVHRTSHNNYEIQTSHVLQNRSGQQMAEKDRNSAKMLVILVSGEQRLITFTLPRESCTVQDLLEQVGVPFDSTTTIQCVENPGANIDFVVTVGFSVQESASELISRAEQSLQMSRQQDSNPATAASSASTSSCGGQTTTIGGASNSAPAASTASNTAATYSALTSGTAASGPAVETTKETSAVSNSAATTIKAAEEVPRKIIQGFYAICQSCGFSGYDHAKCERCRRVFQEPPKRVPCVKNTGALAASSSDTMSLPSKGISELGDKKRTSEAPVSRGGAKGSLPYSSLNTGSRGRGGSTAARGRGSRSGRRAAEAEPVILTLSSDEEEDDEVSNKGSMNVAAANSASSSSQISITYKPFIFEPMIPDKDETPIYSDFQRDDITDLSNCLDKLSTSLQCKLIRIGTYRFEPQDAVEFTSKGICIVAPLVSNPNEFFALHIHKREVVKIIAHFSRVSESMLCFYTLRTCAQYIKTSLQMKDNGVPLDGAAYFSPNGPYQVRKIILQFESISDQARNVIKSIWDFCDEISDTDAQDLLQRAADTDRQLSDKSNDLNSGTTTTQLNSNEIRQLLIYPAGKGGISINTEDYMCLATDQYLNDIIIDFYLKWVHNNVIPVQQREKTFIFSTFFYKRLTTLTRHHHDRDVKQTAAQKRHARVQNWTKNVNLFEKDFIIIPINEQSHWFLAIICFPKLKGPVTFDTNMPVEPQQIKKQKGKKVSLQIGNTTITPLSKRESANVLPEVCGVGDEDSERDEAEGDESDLASEDSDFDNVSGNASTVGAPVANNTTTSTTATTGSGNSSQPQAIKQPLILIFDSLAGASRSRVVATLRDYLTCEYRVKLPDAPLHVFNKDNMPGHCVKVPQQNNFTDCGLYLLQYVEQFFKDPIRDYRLPIKQLSNWFDTLTVTRKREDISLLLQQLMNERNGPNQQVILPDIPFPTQNGQLFEPPEGYNIEFEEEEMGEDAVEEDEEHVAGTEECVTDADMDEPSGKAATKITTATTALVPTQGRKIVVKRRLQVVNVQRGNNNNNSGNIESNEMGDALATQSGGRACMVKIRKVEQ